MPQLRTQILVGHREVDDGLEATGEGLIDVRTEVGGEDDCTGEILDTLEQVGHFLVGMAVIGRVGRGSLAEKGICLSASSACSTKKKQNRVLADFGLSPEDAESALRVGLSRFTTEEEAKALAEALEQMKTEVRRCR